MCGITGVINFEKRINPNIIKTLINELDHRGPDHQNVYKNSFCNLGYTRLSILDLTKNSNQPFVSKNKDCLVFYNGEIYNFKSLRKSFDKNEYCGNGDGEIILNLYKKFGERFVDHLRGMFSICILNLKKKEILLYRDRFGIKPLYFVDNFSKDKSFYFSSEIKPLLTTLKSKKKINYQTAFNFLNRDFSDCYDTTWFSNINQILPGQFIKIKRNRVEKKFYYKLEDNISEDNKLGSEGYDYENEIFKLLNDTFNIHTNADVKIGYHMSSGVDSALLSTLNSLNNKKLNAFSFGFKNKKFDESNQAKQICECLNIKHQTHFLNEDNLENKILELSRVLEEPYSSLRILNTLNLFKFNKSLNYKVILDGSGGDEIASGYPYYIFPWYLDQIQLNNSVGLEQDFKSLLNSHESLNSVDYLIGSIKSFYTSGQSSNDGSNFSSLLNKDFIKNQEKNISEIHLPFKSNLRNAQLFDLKYRKIPRSLRYIDRCSMINSIEARVPLLDHKIVEAFFSLPANLKIKNKSFRYLFHKIINKKISFNQINKNKKTLADPQTIFYKKNLKNLVMDILNSNSFSSEIFDKEKCLDFYKHILKSKNHINSYLFGKVISTEIWRNEFKV